ncbi:MAG TPA: hypothetical protein VLK22_00875 [Candidatus Udaeobacter sp.]|nr:hypothetical protein [Candidatus Udaeobacter sp.]
MNTINIIAGLTSGIFAFIAFVRMWYCMRKEGARPNLLTWGVWAILAFVLLKSEWEAIGTNWALAMLFNDLVCISVTAIILVFLAWRDRQKLSIPKNNTIDASTWINICCLVAIGAASIVWWQTSSAFIALLCYLSIDFLAIIPTLWAVWKDYESEDSWEWVLFQVSNTTVIFTVTKYDFQHLAYPLVVCAIATAVNVVRGVAWWRQEKKNNNINSISK